MLAVADRGSSGTGMESRKSVGPLVQYLKSNVHMSAGVSDYAHCFRTQSDPYEVLQKELVHDGGDKRNGDAISV